MPLAYIMLTLLVIIVGALKGSDLSWPSGCRPTCSCAAGVRRHACCPPAAALHAPTSHPPAPICAVGWLELRRFEAHLAERAAKEWDAELALHEEQGYPSFKTASRSCYDSQNPFGKETLRPPWPTVNCCAHAHRNQQKHGVLLPITLARPPRRPSNLAPRAAPHSVPPCSRRQAFCQTPKAGALVWQASGRKMGRQQRTGRATRQAQRVQQAQQQRYGTSTPGGSCMTPWRVLCWSGDWR